VFARCSRGFAARHCGGAFGALAKRTAVSKAVRGHWPLEGSNPSPSASAEEPLFQAVSGYLNDFARERAAVKSDNTIQSRWLLSRQRMRR
jgi:hypothetical protein